MFGSVGRTACDATGDMVFNVGTGIVQMGPFLAISSDGSRHAVYELPPDLSSFGDLTWAITPGGKFFVLHGDAKGYKLVRFEDDGSVGQVTTVDIPAAVHVKYFAIADNETMYVGGYRESHEPLKKPSAGFAALLDASGKMIRDLSSDAPPVDLNAAQFHPLDGDVTAGEDGRFYVLRSTEVLVLNQAGDVEGELKFAKPAPDSYARRVDYSKGLVSVVFHSVHRAKPGQAAGVQVRTILLNAQTGEQVGDFVFATSTTGSVLCFNAGDGYSLMAVDGRMAAMDVVPLR